MQFWCSGVIASGLNLLQHVYSAVIYIAGYTINTDQLELCKYTVLYSAIGSAHHATDLTLISNACST